MYPTFIFICLHTALFLHAADPTEVAESVLEDSWNVTFWKKAAHLVTSIQTHSTEEGKFLHFMNEFKGFSTADILDDLLMMIDCAEKLIERNQTEICIWGERSKALKLKTMRTMGVTWDTSNYNRKEIFAMWQKQKLPPPYSKPPPTYDETMSYFPWKVNGS